MTQTGDSTQGFVAPRPLEGIRVLDLTHILAGPYCTMMLGDAGAEVVKIERPGKGETARQGGPYVNNKEGQKVSVSYLRLARNKKNVAINLQDPRGQGLFKQLVKVSDVVVENFFPGVMKKLGLDYDVLEQVNPAIIYATISGYGRLERLRGPYSQRGANNTSVQAMGGIMDVTGDPDGPPTLCGVSVGDVIPGMYTAYGIILALQTRAKTGRGQHVDISMYDCMAAINERVITNYQLTGTIVGRRGEGRPSPAGVIEAKNGHVAVAGLHSEEKWANLWKLVGREDILSDPDLSDGLKRLAKWRSYLVPILEDWAKDKTKEEVTDLLLGLDLSVGQVQNAKDLYECEHLRARNMIIAAEDPALGRVEFSGNPVKMSHTPEPTPTLDHRIGAYTGEVLTSLLGLAQEQIEELRNAGVVQ